MKPLTVSAQLRLTTWLLLGYGILALVWLIVGFASDSRSDKVPWALLWLPIGIGLLRYSPTARMFARILLVWSVLVVAFPFLALVSDPRSSIAIALPFSGEFESTAGVAALMVLPWLVLTIWQWRILSLPEVAARFKAASNT